MAKNNYQPNISPEHLELAQILAQDRSMSLPEAVSAIWSLGVAEGAIELLVSRLISHERAAAAMGKSVHDVLELLESRGLTVTGDAEDIKESINRLKADPGVIRPERQVIDPSSECNQTDDLPDAADDDI